METLLSLNKLKMNKNIFYLSILLCVLLLSCHRFNVIGDNYKLEMDHIGHTVLTDTSDIILIDGHILRIGFDSIYVIVEQKPERLIYTEFKKNNPGYTYDEAKRAFYESTLTHYWIVNKQEPSIYSYDKLNKLAKQSNVYGPFDNEEFLEKRIELGVHDSLKLGSKSHSRFKIPYIK